MIQHFKAGILNRFDIKIKRNLCFTFDFQSNNGKVNVVS